MPLVFSYLGPYTIDIDKEFNVKYSTEDERKAAIREKCKLRMRKYRSNSENKTKQLVWDRDYYRTPAGHIKWMLGEARKRAVKKGLDFNIDRSDIIVPSICPILNIPLFRGDRAAGPNSPSLDRIDSSKGYIKGNVQVISNKANLIKSDATPEELMKVALFMSNL